MSQCEKFFDDFIKLPNITLKSLGCDFLDKRHIPRTPKSSQMKMFMQFYFFLTLVCCLYCTYFVADETLKQIKEGVPDLPLLLRLTNDFSYNAIGILKSLYFIRGMTQHTQLLLRFRKIFPKTVEERQAYRVNDKCWPRWINLILYFYFVAVAFILFSPLAESIVEYLVELSRFSYADVTFGYNKLYQEQSYIVDHHNPLAYVVIYAMEAMNSHYAIVFNICPDIWLVSYIIQLCMHFDYISRSLEYYEPQEENREKDAEFIAYVVEKHQVLLELANDLKDLFSSLVLVMLLSTVTTLFCAGVYLTSQGVNRNLFGYLAFLFTSLGQYYIICYYGQQLINKSSAVGLAAYRQYWYNGCQAHKKSILMILEQAQLECEINAGGFQTINLKGFQSVIQMTYQLFTVCRTMLTDNEN